MKIRTGSLVPSTATAALQCPHHAPDEGGASSSVAASSSGQRSDVVRPSATDVELQTHRPQCSLLASTLIRRTKLITAAVILTAPMLPLTEASADTSRIESRVPGEDLATALQSFASARGIDLRYKPSLVKGLETRGVDGNVSAREELAALLQGTGLTFTFTGGNAVTLVPAASAQSSVNARDAARGGGAGDAAAPPAGSGDLNRNVPLDTVTVTAQKRSEPLATVPVPVTVLESSDLTARNELRLQDYYAQVPGLQYSTSPNLGGLPYIAIRGIIAASGDTPTVEPTIDGVSFGSSTGFGGGYIVPDLDPSDLQRIEVLKGPQGTLYGANSLGGLLQYVTVDPSLGAVSGRIAAGGSYVDNGAQGGFNARGALNVPLTDTLAVRVSGYARQDPGYVYDPTYHLNGVNKVDSGGGHVAVLYQPSDSFSAKLSALFQHDEQYGAPYVDSPNVFPNPPAELTTSSDLALVQNRLPDTGRQDRTLQAYILTLDSKLNPFGHAIDLTSISSFSRFKYFDSIDLTVGANGQPSAVPAIAALLPPGAPGVGVISASTNITQKETEELRLSTAIGSRVDWLLGTFFTHENSGPAGGGPGDGVYAVKVGAPPVPFLVGPTTVSYKEYAVFTDFTFKFTDRFDVQVGGRATKDEQTLFAFVNYGPTVATYLPLLTGGLTPQQVLGIPPGGLAQRGESSDTSGTYLLTPRYKLIDDASAKVMVYARLSSGFRPGGVNPVLDPNAQLLPAKFGADRTQNYDLGIKADLLHRTLFIDLSAFYIDWKSIQLGAIGAPDPATGFQNSGFVNGAGARSDGLELQTEDRPLPGLTLDATATYDDAVLSEAVPPLAAATVVANPGDRLPLSAKFVGSFGANYELPLPLSDGLRGFAGAQYSYTGGRFGAFEATAGLAAHPTVPPYRTFLGAYGVVNAQLGVKLNGWTAELYGTNLANRRGVLGGDNSSPYSFIYITPATYGLEISTEF